MSSKFKEGRKVGKGVADWWVLGTRPLGMALHELLDDTETMQIKRKRGGNANTDRWHCGPAQETLGAPFCLVCVRDLYSENLSTVQSRLLVYEKRVTATHPRVE